MLGLVPRARLRRFLLENVGRTFHWRELRRAVRLGDPWRALRDLRRIDGYLVVSHRDSPDLRRGDYRLESAAPVPVIARGLDPELRSEIVSRRSALCCLACGAVGGQADDRDLRRRVRLRVDRVRRHGDGRVRLRILCNWCRDGGCDADLLATLGMEPVLRVERRPRPSTRRLLEPGRV